MGHTWTLVIWTAQALFDLAVCVLVTVIWLASR
jgi:hypothetical protein